jgi:hypothetical protein
VIAGVVIVAVIAIVLIVVAAQSSEFRVKRSAALAASAPALFAQVNDFRNWAKCSPFERLDPNMTKSYEGTTQGAGAIYRWSGNKKAGEGAVTITESRPYDLIRMELEFRKPFRASNTVEFTFVPERERTVVTWDMIGRKNFVSKVMCMFVNMDKMVGRDFEDGLTKLGAMAQGSPR